VCVLLSFASLHTYRLNYFNVTIGKSLINRHTYMMFRTLEMMTLDLLCLYSNTVPKYLEKSIRDTQSVAPVRSKEIFQFIQQGPSEVLDHADSVLFPDANLKRRSCHILVDTDLCPVTKDS
jgi:hypothetical protein